ncbi:MAG: sugar transferase [Candidatus Promineifilaceae bacterium]|nr:sugar transferase [Candidatus Promineifilaceae bacterium]
MLYKKYGKRTFDLVFSIAALILLSPLLITLTLLVRRRLGAPVFFRQKRPGLNGRPFVILKFRTMTNERDNAGHLLPDSERLIPFGHFLRSTSLDELPELFNVIKGQMSLVGPRPLLMRYLDLYTPEQKRRNDVKPGMTGWAQVNGRNELSWEEKFALDVWYVDHLTFRLDLTIILRTTKLIIKREGINQPGQATVQPFTGNGN